MINCNFLCFIVFLFKSCDIFKLRPVWYSGLIMYFQFLNNITHIFTHFFITRIFKKYKKITRTTLRNEPKITHFYSFFS